VVVERSCKHLAWWLRVAGDEESSRRFWKMGEAMTKGGAELVRKALEEGVEARGRELEGAAMARLRENSLVSQTGPAKT
jgi:hypothetical protein